MVGRAQATATTGSGGILRDPRNRPWLLSTSLGGKTRQLIQEASRRLSAPSNQSGDQHEQYNAKRALAGALESEANRELSGMARGGA